MELECSDNCLLCNKKFYGGEPIICKLPENVCFCLKCSQKFEDNNKYVGINRWVALEYQPGTIFEYNKD